MNVLEIKQALSRMSRRDRQDVQAFLIRLRHNTPEWKRATAKRLREMQAGKAVTAEALAARLAHG